MLECLRKGQHREQILVVVWERTRLSPGPFSLIPPPIFLSTVRSESLYIELSLVPIFPFYNEPHRHGSFRSLFA